MVSKYKEVYIQVLPDSKKKHVIWGLDLKMPQGSIFCFIFHYYYHSYYFLLLTSNTFHSMSNLNCSLLLSSLKNRLSLVSAPKILNANILKMEESK